jgi:hypothetical protein
MLGIRLTEACRFFYPYQAIANFSEEVTNSFNDEVHRVKWHRNFNEAPLRYESLSGNCARDLGT